MTSKPSRLTMPTRTDPAEKWLEHLNAVYTVEFNLLNISASIAAVAIPLLLGLLNQVPENCANVSAIARVLGTASCVSDGALAALPLAPLIVLLFYAYIFFNGRIVGKYARSLERALSPSAPGELSFPAMSRINGALYGGERPRLIPLRIVYVVLAVGILAVSVTTMASLLSRIDSDGARIVATLLYSSLTVLLLAAFSFGASHRVDEELWQAVIDRDSAKTDGYVRYASWGSFLLFALVPRPLSLVGKGADSVVVAVLLGLLVAGQGVSFDPAKFVIGILIFEGVLYQTRYLMNGLREDASLMPRLPANRRNDAPHQYSPTQRVIGIVLIALRCGLFLYLVVHFGILSPISAAWILGAFLVAVYAYEIPREVWRHKYRAAVDRAKNRSHWGRKLQKWVANELGGRSLRLAGITIIVTGALGYALRAAVAVLLLAGQSVLTSVTGLILVASVWVGATAQLTAGWVVELQGAISRNGEIHAAIVTKPHLAWSRRWLTEIIVDPVKVRMFGPRSSREKEVIVDWRDRQSRRSPWIVSTALATAIVLAAPFAVKPESSTRYLVLLALAVPVSLLASANLPRPWGTGNFMPSLFTAAAGLALGLQMVSVPFALGLTVAASWPQHRLRTAQSARLYDLIRAAQEAWEKFGRSVGKIKTLLLMGLEIAVGYPVLDALGGRGRRRVTEWP